MREPRGHPEMYGAILVAETELTERGEADIGVLFCHNGGSQCMNGLFTSNTHSVEGYSTMCGHATIALGRMLVDTHDLDVFPRRESLSQEEDGTTRIRLHAPCGVVHISVPTTSRGGRSDATRPVSFLCVPSFVTARNLVVSVPEDVRWAGLKRTGRSEVTVDVAYGGAFYVIVSAEALGFPDGFRGVYRLSEFEEATRTLKKLLAHRAGLFEHPSEGDLQYLYGVMVVDETLGGERGEVGLCYFADQQVDRSPTGSCVSARVALAVEKGRLKIGESWTYESVVSVVSCGNGFIGTAVEISGDGIVVRVSGTGYYTGSHSFVEEGEVDRIGATGFVLVRDHVGVTNV